MASGDTTPEQRLERLRGLLTGTRSDSRTAGMLARGDKANVLIGAALHAADRLRQGKTATDLEQMTLAVLRTAMSDQEIKDWGGVYRESVSKLGKLDVVPEALTSRPVDQGYSLADLKAGFAPVAAEHMAQSNTALIDREALAAGGSVDTPAFIAGMHEWGSGVTAFSPGGRAGVSATAQDTEAEEAAEPAADPPAFKVKLELENFYVHRAVGDQGGGRDEIYWTCSIASDKAAGNGYMSEEFGAVKKGQTRAFSTAKRTVFDATAGKGVVLFIQCWEADQSTSEWHDALQRALQTLSQRFFTSWWWNLGTGVLPGTDLVGYMGEIINLFAFLMYHLRNEDDLSCQRMIALDRFDLALLAHRGKTSWHFNGDGYHELRVKYSGDKVPFPTGKLEYVVYTGDTPSAPITLDFESMTPPALRSYDGKLHALYVRPSDQAVMWTFQNTGGNWSTPQRIHGWKSFYAPALAVHNNKLYTVITAANDDGTQVWALSDGHQWTTTTSMAGTGSNKAPALGHWGGSLCAVHVGKDQHVYDFEFNGSGWANRGQAHKNWVVNGPVGLASYQGVPWRAVRGTDNSVYMSRHTGSWQETIPAGGWRITAGPTLVTHNDKLWVFLPGMDGSLYSSTYTGGPWSGLKTIAGSTPQRETAAAVHNGKLYVMYHR